MNVTNKNFTFSNVLVCKILNLMLQLLWSLRRIGNSTNELGGWHITYFGSDATSTFSKERSSSIKPKLRKAEPLAVILDHNRQKEIGVKHKLMCTPLLHIPCCCLLLLTHPFFLKQRSGIVYSFTASQRVQLLDIRCKQTSFTAISTIKSPTFLHCHDIHGELVYVASICQQ